MKQAMKGNLKIFLVLALVILSIFAFVGDALASVSFANGQYVRLGYATATPLVW